MKLPKIILIIVSLFFLTGCNTNYKSLNDISVVSSLLIDKKDDKYITHLELYKDKFEDNNSSQSSYFISGSGTNIDSSIKNASKYISKSLYFIHINTVIISESVAKNNIDEIFNYLESNVMMNSNYYVLISNDINKLVNNKDNSILGEKIIYSIKNGTNNGTMIRYDFMDILKNYLSNNRDIFLNNIEISNNNIKINNGYYFSNNNLVGNLNNNELKIINMFLNNKNIFYNINYNNNEFVIKINNSKVKYSITNDIIINFKIDADIYKANYSLDIGNEESIENIIDYSNKVLENDINKLIVKLKNNNSDILGINEYIYKIYGNNKKDFFKDDININVNITMNKNGLINNTIGGYNE